jgi:hypothetical protein
MANTLLNRGLQISANLIHTHSEHLFALTVGICVFVGSYFFAPYYTEGDQWVYVRAYQAVEGLDLKSAYSLYEMAISGGEYLHFLIIWAASTLAIEKNLFMALANSTLSAYAYLLARHWGGIRYLILFLIFTNFYLYVLYFSAERLKFGFIFLIISLLNIHSSLIFIFFSSLALLSHHSLIFIYSGIWLMMTATTFKRPNVTLNTKLIWIVLPSTLALIILAMGSFHIGAKLHTYLNRHNTSDLMTFGPIALLVTLSCIYSKELVRPILTYLPIIIGIVFLGGSRLNMLGYFIFLYYCLNYRSGLNFGMIATSIYFGYKSIGYVSSVIHHGHGFQ